MIIIAFDPAGNWNDHQKGDTGVAIWNNHKITTKTIAGNLYTSRMEYWETIMDLIYTRPDIIICEDFVLYAHKANEQIWDPMETPRLIGAMEYISHSLNDIPFILQKALIKNRWSNKILVHKNIIKPYGKTAAFTLPDGDRRLSGHELDALRHLIHAITFNKLIKAKFIKENLINE
jgi:hypothetical protein